MLACCGGGSPTQKAVLPSTYLTCLSRAAFVDKNKGVLWTVTLSPAIRPAGGEEHRQKQGGGGGEGDLLNKA